jgi:putative flippase GtrA
MLFLISKAKMPLSEQVINTVYIDDNSSSHFRVVRDSLRIYKTVLTFALISIISTLIDITSITAQNSILPNSAVKISFFALAVVYARILSGIINYLLNRSFVFDKDGGFASFFKYLAVLIPIFAVTAGAAYILDILSAPIWLAWLVKIVISIILFPLSFRLQHNFVFNKVTRK